MARRADLERLLDFYKVARKQRRELLDLARRAEQRGLLRMNNQNLPEDWRTWADFEDEASSLLDYEPLVVPACGVVERALQHALLEGPRMTRWEDDPVA